MHGASHAPPLVAAEARHERQAQHSDRDQHDAGPSAGALMLSEKKRACDRNDQRRSAPHQWVDNTLMSPVWWAAVTMTK